MWLPKIQCRVNEARMRGERHRVERWIEAAPPDLSPWDFDVFKDRFAVASSPEAFGGLLDWARRTEGMPGGCRRAAQAHVRLLERAGLRTLALGAAEERLIVRPRRADPVVLAAVARCLHALGEREALLRLVARVGSPEPWMGALAVGPALPRPVELRVVRGEAEGAPAARTSRRVRSHFRCLAGGA